jgi:hypothetical protein
MLRIRLPRGEWYYDPDKPLGPEGGFGEVFAGAAEGHEPLAIKKIKLRAEDAAHRELRIADEFAGSQFSYIVPILDSGQDAESNCYFVVMLRAEKSLQDALNARRAYTETDVAKIMLQIAYGLSEVPHLVHRDLKPGNVLYHGGKWKVADFGIARFVEESTSLRTLQGFLSPQYAAPEQWRLERSTHATDVYALGCIGYALLTGQPPFAGPRREDFKQQHLYSEPPRLTTHTAQLRSLLTMMLRKYPESRPTIDRVKHLLSTIIDEQGEASPGAGVDLLAQVGAEAAERAAEEEAKQTLERSKQKKRYEIALEATKTLLGVAENLCRKIMNLAPTAKLIDADVLWQLDLDQKATLVVSFGSHVFPENAFHRSGWDVITGATISVHQHQPPYWRSASLLYTNLGSGEPVYRWYEVSFFAPLSLTTVKNVPFALKDIAEADEGIATGGRYRIASGPYPIDDENVDDFCNRWSEILAKAYKGQLEHPRHLPLD